MSSLRSRARLLGLAAWLWGRWRRMPRRVDQTPLHRLLGELDAESVRRPRPASTQELADAATLLVYRVPSGVRNTCLVRSLTLYGALRSAGHAAQIVFAVRPGERIEDGHAWLELGREPFFEPDERRHGFVEIFRHPEHP